MDGHIKTDRVSEVDSHRGAPHLKIIENIILQIIHQDAFQTKSIAKHFSMFIFIQTFFYMLRISITDHFLHSVRLFLCSVTAFLPYANLVKLASFRYDWAKIMIFILNRFNTWKYLTLQKVFQIIPLSF